MSDAYQRAQARKKALQALGLAPPPKPATQTLATSKIQYGVLKRLKEGADPVSNLYKRHPKNADRILHILAERGLITLSTLSTRTGVGGVSYRRYILTKKGHDACDYAIKLRRQYSRF